MIKVRLQGTVDDMKWLEEKMMEHPNIMITESSEPFQNKGTNRYFRRYLEVDKKIKND